MKPERCQFSKTIFIEYGFQHVLWNPAFTSSTALVCIIFPQNWFTLYSPLQEISGMKVKVGNVASYFSMSDCQHIQAKTQRYQSCNECSSKDSFTSIYPFLAIEKKSSRRFYYSSKI